MTQLYALLRPLALSLLGAVVLGCSSDKKATDDTAAPRPESQPTVAEKPSKGPVAGDVIKLGESYDYPTESDPIEAPKDVSLDAIKTTKNPGVDQSLNPGLTLAAPVDRPKTTYPTDQEIVARISSKRAYHGLGIGEGANYLWRPKPNPNGEAWLVSTKPPNAIALLRRGFPFSHEDPTKPRIVYKLFKDGIVYGVCVEDPVLCGGHCGYTQ